MAGQATVAETEAVAGQKQSNKMRHQSVVAAAAQALASMAAVAAAVAAATVVAATLAGADCSCDRHGHRPIYSRGGVCCSTGNQLGDIQQHFGYFC
jgi:hypothetical protein